jgi:hypothetical protein
VEGENMKKIVFGSACMIFGILFLQYLILIGWNKNHDFGLPANILGCAIIIFGVWFAISGLRNKNE